jgi:hypothetical protein
VFAVRAANGQDHPLGMLGLPGDRLHVMFIGTSSRLDSVCISLATATPLVIRSRGGRPIRRRGNLASLHMQQCAAPDSGDGLAVTWRRGMYHASPEAGRHVKQRLMHLRLRVLARRCRHYVPWHEAAATSEHRGEIIH